MIRPAVSGRLETFPDGKVKAPGISVGFFGLKCCRYVSNPGLAGKIVAFRPVTGTDPLSSPAFLSSPCGVFVGFVATLPCDFDSGILRRATFFRGGCARKGATEGLFSAKADAVDALPLSLGDERLLEGATILRAPLWETE